MARTASVVDEADDRTDPELAQPREPLVRPRPVCALEAVGRDALPEDGVADGSGAEPREKIEVA